ncbi:Bacterial regulatory protein, luxR family [compost metagenome]
MADVLFAGSLGDTASMHMSTLIDSIGRGDFFPDLLRVLHTMGGAEHCAIYQLTQGKLSALGWGSWDGSQTAQDRVTRYVGLQYWRQDPALSELQLSSGGSDLSVVRTDPGHLPSEVRSQFYSDIRDRMVICGQRCETSYCLSVLRSDRTGAFAAAEFASLASMGALLISLIIKHSEVLSRRPHLALSSLAEIENCMLVNGGLSRRESEVCARTLFGISSTGIALDLGIGEETVKTYRNRAHQKLGVGSPREVLIWYLSLWSSWDANDQPALLLNSPLVLNKYR